MTLHLAEEMTNLRPSCADGHTLVLPPGWLRLDARTDRGTAVLDRELDQPRLVHHHLR